MRGNLGITFQIVSADFISPTMTGWRCHSVPKEMNLISAQDKLRVAIFLAIIKVSGLISEWRER